MKLQKKLFLLILSSLFAGVILLQSGCVVVAAGAGAGTVAWVRGELKTTVNNDLKDVVKASTKAVEDLKFALVSSKQDVLTGEVIARTIDDKKIEIIAKSESTGVTTIHIRVGVFGDQRISQLVLEEIKKNL